MSLKRTPPKSRSPSQAEDMSGSLHELCSTESQEKMNITFRKKQPKGASAASDVMSEMKSLFEVLASSQESKLNQLHSVILEIKAQNEQLTSSMDFISNKYDEMERNMSLLLNERKADREHIKHLEDKIEYLERYSCSARIEIRNVPGKSGESKEDLCSIAKSVATAVSVPLETSDVRDIYRVNSKSEAKTIVLEFNSILKKENMMNAVKKFNKVDIEKKLNTEHLKLSGPVKPVYISEMLTVKGRRLRFLANNFAKSHKYKYCWSSYGRIYLRKTDDTPQILIKDEGDLEKLKTAPK